ncbi:MAG: glycoside hydrolase family 97 protein [Opitutales bacterium]|nr:glycoside hydrolase family 97 protein [Opitutales bacterium]
MKLLSKTVLCLFSLSLSLHAEDITSPDGSITLSCNLNENGSAVYQVDFHGKTVIAPSALGFTFLDAAPLSQHLRVAGSRVASEDDTWELPWGEKQFVQNRYNELQMDFVETGDAPRSFSVIFRVFDDGIGFRYRLPEQPNLAEAQITDELTQFRMTSDPDCWWIPGDWDSYEHLYNHTKLSQVNALKETVGTPLSSSILENAVNTPVTMKTDDGIYLSFHEANLTDYAGMTLKVDTQNLSLSSSLVGSRNTAYKVKRELPFSTPWRTVQISDNAPALIDSDLILNLNEPNKIGDVSTYFTPMKYVGIWWDMHVRTKTWQYEGGQHGATTEYAKELIDFAAQNNLGGILVEGWNTGWEHWIGFDDREGVFDFVTPYPDYDLAEVVRYGKSKGVELIMHHETSAAVTTYDECMDNAFTLMECLGVHAVKTGYVGDVIPRGEYHHGQWMVNHYRRVIEKAALYNIAVNAHEPIKDTGIRRTYPNAIAREGLRGQEYNAWSPGGNPPAHLPTVAFTRMLSGPIDFTPGVFNIKLDPYTDEYQVNTTLAKQLALYVVILSPIQMVPDLIENYQGEPAMQFIRDVAVDWQESHTLNGEVGQYVTIARKERNGDRWFLGSITDEQPRDMEVALDFLDPDTLYKVVIYADAPDAHWDDNPCSYTITRKTMRKGDALKLHLAPGGGVAVSLTPFRK